MRLSRKQLLCASAVIISIMMVVKKRNVLLLKKKRVWTKRWIGRRMEGRGILNMLDQELLTEDAAAYKNFLRMNNGSFESLLKLVENKIRKQDTKFRESISARCRLETTLRFLATGETFRSLMYSTRIHESSISRFIPEVCEAIYSSLKEIYLKTPNSTIEWMHVAKGFEESWQFPHCIGALDGRHINFRPPVSAGSFYYNYKGNHSIVLLAMCDSAYKFTYYNVGINGRVSDGGVFRECNLSKALANNTLNLPPNEALPGRLSRVPYVLIADDAFPITDRIMKPYPSRGLSYSQKIYNYRLSRARRMIETSFGILANRFRVLLNPISLNPNKVEKITLACLALHNFLASENWKAYTAIDDKDLNVMSSNKLNPQAGNRTTVKALNIRDEFKDYFNSENGAVNWQDEAIRRHNM